MKNLIRRWLGLPDDFAMIHKHLTDLHDEMIGMRSDLQVTFKDEHDPKRKEMSDKLGRRAIEKLNAEDWARRHTLGEI
jgi:hypothetical protein